MPRGVKGKGVAKVIGTVLLTAICNRLYNEFLEYTINSGKVTLDPLDIAIEAYYALFGDGDWGAIKDSLFENIGNLPFAQPIAAAFGVDEIGQIPMSGLLPDVGEIRQEFKDKNYLGGVFKLAEPIAYALNPVGGIGQLKKTGEGILSVVKGDSRYAIEQTPGNFIKAGIFGKNSLTDTKEYWEKKDKLGYAKSDYEENPNEKNAVKYEQRSIVFDYQSEMMNAIEKLPEEQQAEARKFLNSKMKAEGVLVRNTYQINPKVVANGLTDSYIIKSMPGSTIKWTADNEAKEYSMTPKEYTDFSVEYLDAYKKHRNKFAESSIFNNLSNDDRKEVFRQLDNYSESSAKDGLGGYSMSSSNQKIKELEKKGIPPYVYITAKISTNGIEGDKNYKGKTITYSKDINCIKAIKKNVKGLTQKQYIDLFNALGYNENVIKKYTRLP